MAKVAIFYGSDGGATKDVCERIAAKLGDADLFDVANSPKDEFENYNAIILASSTWGDGELQADWEDFIDELDDVDFDGKTVAFVGLGDQDGYGDTFCNSLSYFAEKTGAAKLVGKTSTEGYDYEESESVVDGQFLGLCIDEDNQDELTEGRIDAWVNDIKADLGL